VWEGWNVIHKEGVIHLVKKDVEEGDGFFTRVGSKLRLELDDECGGDGRK
jgi:hypothetical protein